jgi:hypothetical protein
MQSWPHHWHLAMQGCHPYPLALLLLERLLLLLVLCCPTHLG